MQLIDLKEKREKERILSLYHDAKVALGMTTMQELADKLGVTRETMYLWASRGEVPVKRAIALEKLLAGTRLPLTRHIIAAWAYKD